MSSSAFKASEKFRVTMVNSEGPSERVTIQLSLDGLKVLTQDGSRTMRSYNLRNVARWDLMDTSTVIWTKTDVDLEERPLTLSSDPTTIRNVVDTLASCCMQLAELIQDKEEAASNLAELATGGGKTRKAAKLPSVDSVEYWRHPDKAGWLQSQSEVMKMWRRRWFVLKQGYLFRFLSPDVTESVKPRGVVDLSKVQDVRDGRAVTGKANTVQLKTATGGSVCYVCESETEMVEWISAIEGSMAKIVKLLAGVDDNAESSSKERRHRSSKDRHGTTTSSSASDWAKSMERSLNQSSSSSSSSRRPAVNGNALVSVVGYNAGGGGLGSSGSYGYSQPGSARASAPAAAGYDSYGGISDYSQIAGIAGVASAMDDLTLNYGGYGSAAAVGPAGGGFGGSSSTSYGSAPTAAYGGAHSSSAAVDGYGGSSSNACGGGAGGYGYAAGGGSSSDMYYGGSSGYSDPAAAGPGNSTNSYTAPGIGVNGYGGAYQQQQQQPGGYEQQYGSPGVGYYQQQQPQQQQQQQQPSGVSLIDQVPSQQPAYPYYQPTTAQGQDAPPAAPPGPTGTWQVHHTAEGRPYYYNTTTGTTQWDAPPGGI